MSENFCIYKTRLPLERIWNTEIDDKRKQFYEEIYSDSEASREIYSAKNISFPQNFIGMNLMGQDCNLGNFNHAIKDLTGTIEYMCHPVIITRLTI
jgi:hypothetical protein